MKPSMSLCPNVKHLPCHVRKHSLRLPTTPKCCKDERSAFQPESGTGSRSSRIATALPCLQRLHVLDEVGDLRTAELRGDAVCISAPAAAEAVAKGRCAAV